MKQKLKLLILCKALLFLYNFRKYLKGGELFAYRLFYLHIKNIFNSKSIQIASIFLWCTSECKKFQAKKG